MEKHPERPDGLTMLKTVQEQYKAYLKFLNLNKLPKKEREDRKKVYPAPTPENPLTSNRLVQKD